MYLKPADLKRWVTESQAAGTLTPELVGAVTSIVHGVRKRHGIAELEDTIQDALVAVLVNLGKLDPNNGKLFGYLTTLIRNCSHRQFREAAKFDTLRRRVWDGKK